MNRIEIKNKAKQDIRGNILKIFVILMLIYGVSLIVSGIVGGIMSVMGLAQSNTIRANLVATALTFVMTAILAPISLSLNKIFLNISDGIEVKYSDLLWGFEHIGKAICLYFRVFIFTYLWTLLFIIPGIIKSYSYSMSYFVMADNPEMTAKQAMQESMRLMQGHKMELFILQMSFIGWILLSCMTLGILFVYVVPYMETATANFYRELKNNA